MCISGLRERERERERDSDYACISNYLIQICRDHPEKAELKSSMVIGNSAFRKGSLRDHATSAKHLLCEEADRAAKQRQARNKQVAGPIPEAIRRMEQAQREKMTVLFNTAYFIFKEELPFTAFPSILSLQRKNGVDTGTSYLTNVSCRRYDCCHLIVLLIE